MKEWLTRWLMAGGGDLLGRGNLVRVGSYLARVGRRDVHNDMARNGELRVQGEILSATEDRELVVVDCGANVGEWSLALGATAAAVRPEASVRVLAFEPSSFTFARLQANLDAAQKSRVGFEPIQRALSSEIGTAELKIVRDGAGTNSLVTGPDVYASSEAVGKITLDQHASDNGIERIHLLKIDAEGHDFEVMRGAVTLLTAHKLNAVQFEYNWRWIYARRFLRDVFELVVPLGYMVGKVTPHGVQEHRAYGPELESFAEGNYLVFLPELAPRLTLLASWKREERVG